MSISTKQPVIVYTTPSCQQCKAVKRFFTDKGVEYQEIDLSESPSLLDRVKSLGFSQAPVIEVPEDHPVAERRWSGFNPGLMQQLVA